MIRSSKDQPRCERVLISCIQAQPKRIIEAHGDMKAALAAMCLTSGVFVKA